MEARAAAANWKTEAAAADDQAGVMEAHWGPWRLEWRRHGEAGLPEPRSFDDLFKVVGDEVEVRKEHGLEKQLWRRKA